MNIKVITGPLQFCGGLFLYNWACLLFVLNVSVEFLTYFGCMGVCCVV